MSALIFSGLIVESPSFTAGASELTSKQSFDLTHARWTKLLSKHVTMDGHKSTVDYKTIKASNTELVSYLTTLEELKLESFQTFSEADQIAFYINAYNAFTIKLVIDHYPVSSIKKIGGLFSSPWKKEFFKLFENKRSLDEIEHEILRKKYNEPRIHFALVCASKGCPALSDTAFTGNALDSQLEKATKSFLADKDRNKFDSATSVLSVSSIFKWFKEDFAKKAGSLEGFLFPYFFAANTPDKVKIEFLDYDWSLNEK